MKRGFFLGALCGALGLIAIVALVGALMLSCGVETVGGDAPSRQKAGFTGLYNPERIEAGRTRLALEDPRIIARFLSEGTFGGKASRLAGLHMFSRDEAVTEDIRRKTERIEVAPG